MSADRTRIFIVDDHPLVREWLGNFLRLQPEFEISGEASDANEALAQMRIAPPDIAIVDLSLAHSSGFELIASVHDQLPEVQVIVLSMHEELADVERALQAGARGYVMKRESTAQIVSAIHTVHQGGIYADPEMLLHIANRAQGHSLGAVGTPDRLSDRELDVFRRLGDGQSTRQIADELGVGLKTVQTYCMRIKEKLGLEDAGKLMRAAVLWRDGPGRR